MHEKLDRLSTFGPELAQFRQLLQPVISHFVKSSEHPAVKDIIVFWWKIFLSKEGGGSMVWYLGWIMVFCFWDERGVEYVWEFVL